MVNRDLSKKRIFEVVHSPMGEEETTLVIAADNTIQVEQWIEESGLKDDSTYSETDTNPEDVEEIDVILPENAEEEKAEKFEESLAKAGFRKTSDLKIWNRDKRIFDQTVVLNDLHRETKIPYDDFGVWVSTKGVSVGAIEIRVTHGEDIRISRLVIGTAMTMDIDIEWYEKSRNKDEKGVKI